MHGVEASAIFAIERPDRKLMHYYVLRALALPPLAPLLIVPLYFRYHTLRYRFDDEGISMSWGILFRREIHLTYARIQDIHLVSNLVERWLGLARIQIQTASGSAKAEMTLEGILEFEALRDFIYTRMRGFRDPAPARRARVVAGAGAAGDAGVPADAGEEATAVAARDADLAALLGAIADELRTIRRHLERPAAPGGER